MPRGRGSSGGVNHAPRPTPIQSRHLLADKNPETAQIQGPMTRSKTKQ